MILNGTHISVNGKALLQRRTARWRRRPWAWLARILRDPELQAATSDAKHARVNISMFIHVPYLRHEALHHRDQGIGRCRGSGQIALQVRCKVRWLCGGNCTRFRLSRKPQVSRSNRIYDPGQSLITLVDCRFVTWKDYAAKHNYCM